MVDGVVRVMGVLDGVEIVEGEGAVLWVNVGHLRMVGPRRPLRREFQWLHSPLPKLFSNFLFSWPKRN